MFHWNKENSELVVDLMCVDGITISEIAAHVGASKSSIEKYISVNYDKVNTARAETKISDAAHVDILDMWDTGEPETDIASAVGLPTRIVRRIIRAAEFDETSPYTYGADDELEALMGAHPDRLYEDDVRALTEYQHDQPRILCAPREHVTPFCEDRPHRMAVPEPSKKPVISLAA